MRYLDESLARLPPNALRGRIRRDQLRVLRLQILQMLHQLVEIEIADFRLVYHVVQIFVAADLLAESLNRFFGVFARGSHRADYSRSLGLKKKPAKNFQGGLDTQCKF